MQNEIILTNDNSLLRSSEVHIKCVLTQLDELKKQEKQLKESLREEMKKRGVVKVESENMIVTYVAPYQSEKFDSKKLREEKPDVYDEYCYFSDVSDSVRIKLK